MGIFGIIIRILFYFYAEGKIIPSAFEQFTIMRIVEKSTGYIIVFFVVVPFRILHFMVFQNDIKWSYGLPFFFLYYAVAGFIAYVFAKKMAAKLRVKKITFLVIIILIIETLVAGVVIW